jgi:hypothetical protein
MEKKKNGKTYNNNKPTVYTLRDIKNQRNKKNIAAPRPTLPLNGFTHNTHSLTHSLTPLNGSLASLNSLADEPVFAQLVFEDLRPGDHEQRLPDAEA